MSTDNSFTSSVLSLYVDSHYILCYYNLVFKFCVIPSWESGPFIQKHMQFKFGKSCHYTAVLYGAIMALFLF